MEIASPTKLTSATQFPHFSRLHLVQSGSSISSIGTSSEPINKQAKFHNMLSIGNLSSSLPEIVHQTKDETLATQSLSTQPVFEHADAQYSYTWDNTQSDCNLISQSNSTIDKTNDKEGFEECEYNYLLDSEYPQVNVARASRKIEDMESSLEWLLVVNALLEKTVKQQTQQILLLNKRSNGVGLSKVLDKAENANDSNAFLHVYDKHTII
ncbi:hypothetical protein BY458DRAFT_547663 [Sporodiniella umbellata]|nr:hypothetical protein BY458DRAFT_547663 [Sporodiniella umbellata]